MQRCHLRSAWPLQLQILRMSGWIFFGGSLITKIGVTAAADYSASGDDGASCELGSLVRPVILVHGYRGSFLYDSSANYTIEWVDPEDTAPGNEGRGVGDLDLPLTWDGTSLTQDMTDVGPESFDGDDTPSLFLPDGTLTPGIEAVFSDLISIVKEWEALPAARGKRLLYSAAYDWRRDLWEQSERIEKVVDKVLQETSCKPIIAAHSFGGVVVYSGIARYGKALADKLHGVFYGASPFQQFASSLACTLPHLLLVNKNNKLQAFSLGAVTTRGPSATPEAQFTFTSLFTLIPSAAGTCADTAPLLPPSTPPAPPPQPCSPEDFRTGLTCNSEACGRPADWPAGEPFFLSIDLHDPLTWQLFGLGLPTARVLSGLTGEAVLYSAEELTHLAFALRTSARLAEITVGTADGNLSAVAAVAVVHPPAVYVALHLTDVEVPGQGVRDFRSPTSLECVPAPTFGQLGELQCADYRPAVPLPSDGLLPSGATSFKYPELFGPKLQYVNTTVPAPLWLQRVAADPDFGRSPHSTVFQGRTSASGEAVDCGAFPPRIEYDTASGQYPALEAMLCSLVLQGPDSAGDQAEGADMAGVYGDSGVDAGYGAP